MRRATHRITGAEQALDGGHAIVAPVVFRRRDVLGTGTPGAATGCVRAHDIGFGRGELGILVFRIDVGRRPQHRLADGHAEEVVPADFFQMRILESFHRHHVDRSAPGIDLADEGMIAQTGGDGAMRAVRGLDVEIFLADHFLQLRPPFRFVLFAQSILRIGLEVQEVGPDRTIAVLKTGQHDAVFHLRHFRTGLDQQAIGRARRPRRVPDTPRALAHGTRFVDVRCAAGGDDHGLRLEDVVVAGTDVEADGTGHAVFLRLVHQQVRHTDAVEHLVGGFLRGFGDDGFVGLPMNHDLPAAFALVGTGLGVAHERQTPFLELVHGRVDVARHVEQQVLAHHAHEVDARIADMVFRIVLAEAGAHVAVDRIQTLGDRTGAVDVRLLGDDDVLVLPPVAGFPRSTRATQAGATDQNVDVVFNDRVVSHQ